MQNMIHEQSIGVFDAHHPPDKNLLEDCVHCGFCLPSCPTYALWGEEMDSPRGRIYLMELGRAGELEMNTTFVKHFDSCLGCMACLTSCPSGVQYDKLIEATRSQIERNYPRTPADRLFRRMLFELFPHPDRLRRLAAPLWLYQRTLGALLRRTGILEHLPARLRAMEALLPEFTLQSAHTTWPQIIPAQGQRRKRVGMILGCVQRVFFNEVNAATIRVLGAEGCEIVIPPTQGCCGALPVHAGQEADALTMARRMIDSFEQTPFESLDAIVINAAGCGSTLKEYGYLLRDDPQYARRAQAFADKCVDISELLAELEPHAPRHALPLRIAYHDACHLQHAQQVRSQPRKVLQGIPGVEIYELAEAAICCGSAGIYNLVQPESAQVLGDRKVQHILQTQADVLISSNPGCLLQIKSGMARAGYTIPILHFVQIVDAAIQGISAQDLIRSTNKPILTIL